MLVVYLTSVQCCARPAPAKMRTAAAAAMTRPRMQRGNDMIGRDGTSAAVLALLLWLLMFGPREVRSAPARTGVPAQLVHRVHGRRGRRAPNPAGPFHRNREDTRPRPWIWSSPSVLRLFRGLWPIHPSLDRMSSTIGREIDPWVYFTCAEPFCRHVGGATRALPALPPTHGSGGIPGRPLHAPEGAAGAKRRRGSER